MDATHLQPTILDQVVRDILAQYLDYTKARNGLNWKPKFSLQEGLLETIEWYKKNS